MVIEIDIPTRFPKHQEPGLIQVGPLGYFIHVSIIIPVEKLLHLDFLGFSRNSIGCFKPLLDPGGGFILLWSCRAVSEGKRPLHNHFGSDGYRFVTVICNGRSTKCLLCYCRCTRLCYCRCARCCSY